MKLTARLKNAGKKFKLKRVKKPKPPKTIKKNTWRRKLKAFDLTLDRRQRERAALPPADLTEHVCINCGEEFTGRFCPQCGQAGYWSRFSWRQAFLNLLDIWGLGNRPIFRTIRDLFWRPGYMVKEYLNGHRQHYFPPFKLLAITIVFTLFFSFLPGIELEESFFSSINETFLDGLHPTGVLLSLRNAFVWFANFLSRNLLYERLFVGMFQVLCIWCAFRSVSRYNLVETYIFLVFILSQMLLCSMPANLITSLRLFVKAHALSTGGAVMKQFADSFLTLSSLISIVYRVLVSYLLLLDFKQFYGLSWISTIKRLLLSFLLGVVVAFCILLYPILVANVDDPSDHDIVIVSGLTIITIASAFVFAAIYLRKNNAVLNTITRWICKVAMLSVLWGIFIPYLVMSTHKWYEAFGAMFLFVAVAAALSLLPAILYKKYQRTWLSFLSLIPLIVFIVLFTTIIY